MIVVPRQAFSDAIADYIACGFSCANAEGYVKAFGYSEDCDFMYMTSLVGGDSSKPVGGILNTSVHRNVQSVLCTIGVCVLNSNSTTAIT